MSYKNIISKVRYWDNLAAKWIMRHFYFMFFQAALLGIFLFWFVNMFDVIDANFQASQSSSVTEHILAAQSVNMTIIVLLILLNSFWMLFVFSAIQRISSLLRDMNYHLSRLRLPSQKR